jgi:hypothetical protein
MNWGLSEAVAQAQQMRADWAREAEAIRAKYPTGCDYSSEVGEAWRRALKLESDAFVVGELLKAVVGKAGQR